MKVEVLSTPIRHNDSLYEQGESFLITEDQYDRIKKAVKVIDETPEHTAKTIDDMTLAELKEYAKLNNIDLDGATKKEDVLTKIKGGDGDLGGRTGN
ncbi:hypothetical protein [Paenibacillus macerans]|uniref:hypothetical protein n=1 Tax=Paenibacillus macerans TaxID=44252 RepID=UPI00203D0CF5|nr:hypothetical protein [Paenibacillus macerans]MCM3701435.1 hypothetical protein [Paenibacillus macerans]